MKKKMKFSVLLTAIVMAAAMLLAACGNAGSKPQSEAGNNVPGTYTAQYDMAEMMNDIVDGLGMQFEESIMADFTLELNDDDTFSFFVDKDALGEGLIHVFESSGADMIKNLMIGQGISEDQFDTIAAASGFDSMDEMVDSLIDDLKEQVQTSIDAQQDSLHATGTYSIDGNTLKLTSDQNQIEIEAGTINSDGTITIPVQMNGQTKMELIFKK